MDGAADSIYVNRELSWLSFNARVLEEAMCPQTPLLERLKFISIFANNLDEFYMIRVGTLYDQSLLSVPFLDTKTHLTPWAQMDAIFTRSQELLLTRDAAYADVSGALALEGVTHVRPEALSPEEKKYLQTYFTRDMLPLLSPQIVDSRHPFPHLSNKQLYVAVMLSRGEERRLFGLIPVSPALERIVTLPGEAGLRFVLAEDVIAHYARQVFHMYELRECRIFCVTRNADIATDDRLYNEDADYRQYMKEILKKRSRQAAVRLELQDGGSPEFIAYLTEKLSLAPAQVFISSSPIDMRFALRLPEKLPQPLLRRLTYQRPKRHYPTGLNSSRKIFPQVQQGDILLHYPYDSFRPFLDLLREASEDKYVTSIKLTLYRVAQESRLVDILVAAAENGKEVTILLELRARFDEENNINLALRLEEAGCRILYGPDVFKVHAKVCLITRVEARRIQYVTQIGTGNYNEDTARVYTDYSLLTASPELAADATQLFNDLNTGVLTENYRRLLVAPLGLRPSLLSLIDREIDKARAGQPCGITLRLNSITDMVMMDALVRASREGVPVEMLVRGICCLRPGVPGHTENIRITSIVGRFLEHARVYCFGMGVQRQIFIASADLMTRNMERRVEVAAPVLDPLLRRRIWEDLRTSLKDSYKAREMHADGSYSFRRVAPGETPFDSQDYFYQRALAGGARATGARGDIWRKLWEKARGLIGRRPAP